MNGYSGAPGERQRTSVAIGTRLNGIDYVEVELRGADGSPLPRPLLRIYFFDRFARSRAANIRISGGRRITDVAVKRGAGALPGGGPAEGRLHAGEAEPCG